MKKLFSICFVLCALASCSNDDDTSSNDGTCTCTTSYSGEGSDLFDDVVTEVASNGINCSDLNSSTTTAGLTVTVSCD